MQHSQHFSEDNHPLRSYTLDPAFRHVYTLATSTLAPPAHTTTTPPPSHRLSIYTAHPVTAALLIAPSGAGKTSFSRRLPSHLHLRLVPLTRPLTASHVTSAFATAAAASQPCLLLIDDAHLLFPSQSSDPSHHHRLLSTFLSLLSTLLTPPPPSSHPRPPPSSAKSTRVLVLATTTPDEVELLHADFRAAMHHHFTAALPSSTHRLRILSALTSAQWGEGRGKALPEWMSSINGRCQGMTGGDLAALTRLAAFHAATAGRTALMEDDFTTALHSLSPNGLNSAAVPSTSPSVLRLDGSQGVRMEDILGLDDVKRRLMEAVQPLLPSSAIALARSTSPLARALRPPPGLLLYGAPGTGKSMLAQAMAAVPELSFFSLSMPSLLHCHIGSSERALHTAFTLALSSAPAILYIAELDALFPYSPHSADPTSTRFTSVLCSLLSSISTHRLPLLLLATSSRPQAIDPALLQPHRMEAVEVVGVGEKEREEVVRYMMLEAGVGWMGAEGGVGTEEGERDGGMGWAVRRWMGGLTVADVRFLMAGVLREKGRGEMVGEAEVKEGRGRMTQSVGHEAEWELYQWTQRQRRRRLLGDG